MQTLLQAIHISEQEYSNAFGDDGWRKSIRNSVNGNHKYLFPPAPQPAPSALRTDLRDESPQPQPAAVAHPLRGEASHPAQPQPPQPPIAAHSFTAHERRIRSACSGRSSDRFLAGHSAGPTSPTQSPARIDPAATRRCN